MTSAEAAVMLDCTPQHVRYLAQQEALQAIRKGRDWLICSDSVAEYEARRGKKQSAPTLDLQMEDLFPRQEPQGITNVSSVPQRSPFRYPGGKTWLVPIARLWLKSIQPKPSLLVEPFAGGGGIALMAAFEGLVERSHLVELDEGVAAVWQAVFSEHGPELARRILSFDLTLETAKTVIASEPRTLLDTAFRTILQNRVSRGGILAPGAGLVKTGEAGRGINSRWYPETLARRILALHESRHMFSMKQGDGIEAIQARITDGQTAFFVDPPYPVAGKRLYRHHDLDHRKLFEELAKLKGQFLATYDNNADIANLAAEFGFATRLVPMKSTHHARKYELVISRTMEWMPYGLSDAA